MKIKQRKTYGPVGISGVSAQFLKALNDKNWPKIGQNCYVFLCDTCIYKTVDSHNYY